MSVTANCPCVTVSLFVFNLNRFKISYGDILSYKDKTERTENNKIIDYYEEVRIVYTESEHMKKYLDTTIKDVKYKNTHRLVSCQPLLGDYG